MAAVDPDSGSRAVQPAGAASATRGGGGSTEPGLGRRLMSLLRAVYHMLRRGLCRKRLMMDLHLLLGRGKLAGKALRDLIAAAHHSHHHMVVPSSSSSRAAARAPSSASSSALPAAAAATGGLSFAPYDPRDVEYSCTTTPSYSFGGGGGGGHLLGPGRALFPFLRIRGRGSSGAARTGCDGLDFAQVARALEKMHADDEAAAAASSSSGSSADLALLSASPSPPAAGATPSPMLALSLGRSPAGARRLRVTDSPFPVDPPEGPDDARADSTFDAFISKFYETLRLQQADATPDSRARRRG